MKNLNLPGVPGRLLFLLLTEFELGLLGLGFEFEVEAPLGLELEGLTQTASSDIIIFGTEEKSMCRPKLANSESTVSKVLKRTTEALATKTIKNK